MSDRDETRAERDREIADWLIKKAWRYARANTPEDTAKAALLSMIASKLLRGDLS